MVTLVKSVQTKVMNVFSLPKGGAAGQVLVKTSGVDGDATWADVSVSGTMDDQPIENSPNAVKSGGVYDALLNKQDKLSGVTGQIVGFDIDGNAVALDAPVNHLTREVVDALPLPADASEAVVYILKVVDADTGDTTYEEYQLVDGALVRMSGEPVDLSNKQDLLTGLENQYVGFDADGKAIAIDLPEGHLKREVLDALPAVDTAAEDMIYILKIVDANDPAQVSYQQWQLIDGEMVMIGGEQIELPAAYRRRSRWHHYLSGI